MVPKSRPMSQIASAQPLEQPLGLVGARRGGEVEVVLQPAEHRVAHRTADQRQLVAGLGEQRAELVDAPGDPVQLGADARWTSTIVRVAGGVGHDEVSLGRSRGPAGRAASSAVPCCPLARRPRCRLPSAACAALAGGRRWPRRLARHGPAAARRRRPATADPLAVTIDALTPSCFRRAAPSSHRHGHQHHDERWRTSTSTPSSRRRPMTDARRAGRGRRDATRRRVGDADHRAGTFDTIDELAPGRVAPFSRQGAASSCSRSRRARASTGSACTRSARADGPRDARRRRPGPHLPAAGAAARAGRATASVVLLAARPGPVRRRRPPRPASTGWTGDARRRRPPAPLVDFGAAAGTRAVTWLVDPALLDAVDALARATRRASLRPEPDEPGDGPDETTTRAATAAATPSRDEPERRRRSPTTPDATAEDAAAARRAWLDGCVDSRATADPGAAVRRPRRAAAGRHDARVYDQALARSAEVAGRARGLDRAAVVAPPSGYLSPGRSRTVDQTTTVLVTDQMFAAPTRPPVGAGRRRTVVVTSHRGRDGRARARRPAGPSRCASGSSPRRRCGSSPGRAPLVVVLPDDWARPDAAGFFAGLDVAWLDLTTVDRRDARRAAARSTADRPRLPRAAGSAELDAANFTRRRPWSATPGRPSERPAHPQRRRRPHGRRRGARRRCRTPAPRPRRRPRGGRTGPAAGIATSSAEVADRRRRRAVTLSSDDGPFAATSPTASTSR